MASIANRHKKGDSHGEQERVCAAASVGYGNGEGSSAQHGRSPFVWAGAKPAAIASATNDVDFRFLTQRRKDHLKGAEIFSSLFAPLR